MFRHVLVILCMSSLAWPGPLDGQDPFDPVRQQAERLVADGTVAGLAIAVAQGGRLVWEEAFGWADVAGQVPATTSTVFPLASVSKPITGTAIMLLVERGRIDLDAPINRYLEGTPVTAAVGDAREITVRRIANHTAGLARYGRGFRADSVRAPPPMAEVIGRYGVAVFAPGERYEYSNLGYGVLTHLIERVDGRSFPRFMREEIFDPLGMSSTYVFPDSGGLFTATSYDQGGNVLPRSWFDHPGATLVYATAGDLARFGMFHLKDRVPGQGRILPDSAIEASHVPTTGDTTARYGVGWMTEFSRGHRIVTHSGGGNGASSRLYLVPDADVAVAVVSNQNAGGPQEVAREALVALGLAEAFGRDGAAPTPPPSPYVPPRIVWGLWSGTVSTFAGPLPLTVTIDSASIEARLGADSVRTGIQSRPNGDYVEFYTLARMPVDDAGFAHALRFLVRSRGDRMTGVITTVSRGGGGATLPFAISLRRTRDE